MLPSSAYKGVGAIDKKNEMVSKIQKLPIVQCWYRYRLQFQANTSIGFGIEFEIIWQLANVRFRIQTNVYRTTLLETSKDLLRPKKEDAAYNIKTNNSAYTLIPYVTIYKLCAGRWW